MLESMFSVDDLLGRSRLSWGEPPNMPRKVLITGGGGDLARGIGRVLADRGVELALMDQDDGRLLAACTDLRHRGARVTPFLGSVLDPWWVERCFSRFAPDWVIHAAVLKAASLLETDSLAAFRTNAYSVSTVARAAAAAGACRFHLPSSTEAYHPTAIFGVSKLFGEWYAQRAAAEFPTLTVSTVRFGAVLLSTGSVGELFQLQAWQGLPLVVLSPALQRFFFSLPEVSDCCLAVMGSMEASGELLQLDLPAPIRLTDLARGIIQRSRSRSELVISDELCPGDIIAPPGIESMTGLTAGPITHTFRVTEDWDRVGDYALEAASAASRRDPCGVSTAFGGCRAHFTSLY